MSFFQPRPSPTIRYVNIPLHAASRSIKHALARLATIPRLLLLSADHLTSEHKRLQLITCTVLVIIHDHDIMHTGRLRVCQLLLRLLEALLNRLLLLRATASEPLLEVVEGGRRDEGVARIELGGLDLLYALRIC